MNLNCKEIKKLLSEVNLNNSLVQKIYENDKTSFTFSLYSKEKGPYLLFLSISPSSSVFFITQNNFERSKKAQRFTQYLRAHVQGKRIIKVDQVENDRIIILSLKNSSEEIKMIVRMFSSVGANIFITDENYKILEVLYRRPNRSEIGGEYLKIEKREEEGNYEVRPYSFPTFNSFIESLYLEEKNVKKEGKEEIEREKEEKISYLMRKIEIYEKIISSSNSAELLNTANILSSSLHQVKKGEENITIERENGESVTISLEKSLSPSENLEKLYKRYKKEKGKVSDAEKEIERLKAEILKTEDKYNLLLSGKAIIKEREEKDDGKKKIGLSLSSGGFQIAVGRNVEENDSLLRYSRPSDYFLHTRDFPGSYVIIRARKNQSVPYSTILDAVSLAIHFSKAKKAKKAYVHFTEVKNVKRIKNAPKGKILIYHEKTLDGVLDEKRVRELLNDT